MATTPEPQPTIRLATMDDCAVLPSIEDRAGELFRTIDMAAVADDPSPPLSFFQQCQREKRLFVSHTPGNSVLTGYIIIDLLSSDADASAESLAYVHQVSVLPEYARKGVGTDLMAEADAWGRKWKLGVVGLTTFENVPWNRAFYERLGFRVLTEEEMNMSRYKALGEQLERERSEGLLKRWNRVAMVKELDPAASVRLW